MAELEKENLSQPKQRYEKINVGGLKSNNKQDGVSQYIGRDEIVIHTMPKRFFGTQKISGKKAKTIGIIILVAGAAFIIFALIFAYLYFSSINNTPEIIVSDLIEPTDIENSDQEISKTIPKPSPIIESKSEEIKQDAQEIIKNIDVSSTTMPIASSSAISTPATTTKASTTINQKKLVMIAIDSDKDGLSDFEEEVLGSNPQKADSDDDTFDDRSELLKLYNPMGAGQLIVNTNIKKYTNLLYSYSLYYPANWSKETVGGEESIIFNLGNEQFIQIIIDNNIAQDDLETWYKKQIGASPVHEQKFYKKGWFAIKSLDGLIYYLKHPEKNEIIIFSYNLGIKNTISYQNIFQMMINSLELSY